MYIHTNTNIHTKQQKIRTQTQTTSQTKSNTQTHTRTRIHLGFCGAGTEAFKLVRGSSTVCQKSCHATPRSCNCATWSASLV